jgi:hypothetical protein
MAIGWSSKETRRELRPAPATSVMRWAVRPPFVDIPTATYYSARTGSDFLCRMIGYEMFFDQERLRALYPSSNDYADGVGRQVDQMLKDRWRTETDARQLKANAPLVRAPAAQTAK